MQYFEKQGNALIFRQDGETVRVEPWQKDSLRVRGTLLSEIEEGSIALLDPEPMEAEIELVDELKATIKNGKIQAVLELQPWGQKLRITFLNQKGEVLLSEIANGGALCLRAHDYRALKGGAYQLKVSFDSNPDEKIYGMGQYQQERMNLKGCNLELAHRNSQASIPFYVSSLGYGFLWHNAAVGEVHFGTNTTEWLARTTKQLDYWVTAGDTPAEIEEHFADAIGKVPMMPEYGLGFWQCKLRYYNQEQVLNVAREYKKRGIPLDVFVIDYYHWPRCGDYRFDEEYFPDPKAMIDELHEMGIETMVSIWPQIDWRSENYEEMKQQGLLVKSNAGVDVQMLGYGFLWHNAAVGEVHFGTNTTEWLARTTKQLDYWVTAGDTPAEIEEHFADAIGKVPMMPEYGLGFWQCKLRYYNQEQVLNVAREYKKRGIPLDVFVIDYYHWPRCGDYRFDEEYFPDPKAMIDELHEMGIETMVSIWPQIDWRSENYEEMKQQGLLVKSNAGVDVQMLFHGNNVFLDATNPRTRKYVWEKVKKNYADLGIRTFWLDEAEPEFSTYEYECYRYAAGPVEEIGNIYPREYSRMFYEGQKENGQEDIVNLVRCAWLGSQKYGALVWSGDIFSTYEDFRKQICAGLHMGLCGIPWWTTDIGGFHGGVTEDPDFQELLVRWFQFGTFCPVMRIHGNRGPREEIINKAGEVREGTGADNEVWSFGEKNYEILTKFIGVREKMRDYTRSLMAEAHEKGTPVMRTMFYEFPEDAACWDISDAYMFGSDILVAPIVRAKATSRTVYLPAGASWTLANTGDVYEGGKAYEIEAPIETLPIFLRDGKQGYLVGEI